MSKANVQSTQLGVPGHAGVTPLSVLIARRNKVETIKQCVSGTLFTSFLLSLPGLRRP
jgi:hypothetical protein